jgi:hypothetical protein
MTRNAQTAQGTPAGKVLPGAMPPSRSHGWAWGVYLAQTVTV